MPTSNWTRRQGNPYVAAVPAVRGRGNHTSWMAAARRGLVCSAPLLAYSGCVGITIPTIFEVDAHGAPFASRAELGGQLPPFFGPPVPVPVPTKTKDISGTVRELSFTFLKAGYTTREEVEKNLAPIDTGTKEPRFFWGRWKRSSWASAPLLAPYPPLAHREWGLQNILIAFDPMNVVQGWKVLKDKELFQELDRLEQARAAPLDPSAPVRLALDRFGSATLILSAESFEYQASRGFKTARGNLTRITSTSSEVMPTRDIGFNPEPDPAHIWIKIHFAKRAQGRKSLTCGVDPAGFLVLRRYVSETKRQTRPL